MVNSNTRLLSVDIVKNVSTSQCISGRIRFLSGKKIMVCVVEVLASLYYIAQVTFLIFGNMVNLQYQEHA